MKNFLYNLLLGGALTFGIASCMGVDNFDAPSECLTGSIIDVTTGKNILADQGEARVRIWEKSYSLNPSPQDIPVKQDGTYNNNKLFAGTYDVTAQGPWWPVDTLRNVPIGGKVAQNFEVTPYLRITDFTALLDGDTLRVEGRLAAPAMPRYNAERGDMMPQVMDVRCFISTNQFCGSGNQLDAYRNLEVNKKKVTIINVRKAWNSITDGVEDSNGLTYSKDTYKFAVWAKPGYTFFVRMGARVDDDFQNYNYSEIVKIEVPQ
jgi:hypothetical protein